MGWLHRHRHLLIIMAAAVLVRAAVYTQLATSGGGALLQLHRWDQSDMHFYDAWARVIASGDVLTNRPLHPLHDWHIAVARAYLGKDLTLEQVRAAWDDWYGGKRFHQEPLYAYLIAVTYATLGEDVRWVFLWQMAMGVASTLLVVRIGRRHFGEAAAMTAGVMMTLAGPWMFYEMVLLRGPLITFLGLLAVDAAGVARRRGHPGRWALAGAACGLAMLAHGGAQVLVPAVGVLAWLSGWRASGETFGEAKLQAWRVGVGSVLAVVLGTGAALLPVIARNVAAGVGPLQLSSVGAVTFIATNGPTQHKDLSFVATEAIPAVLESAREGGPGVVRGTLQLHDGPGSFLSLAGRKVAMAWRWFEKPNNVGYAYFAEHAWLFKALPVRFAIVAPLALAGGVILVVTRRDKLVEFLPLLALIGVGLLSSVVAAPHARYRAPLVAWMMPWAGFCVVWLIQAIRGNARPQAWAAAGGVVVLFLLTLRPLPAGVETTVTADWLSPYEAWWLPRAEEAAASGDWSDAAAVLEGSLRRLPGVVKAMSRSRPAVTDAEADLARFYAAIYARLGEAQRNRGKAQDALVSERRSMDLVEAAEIFALHREETSSGAQP